MNEEVTKPARKPAGGGKRRLRRGLVRLLPNHSTAIGKALRREYEALVAGLGIDGDVMLQREASRTALLRVRADESARLWAELVERRRVGRGRRPSLQQLERARRASALDAQDARQAFDRLHAMVDARPVSDPLAEFAASGDGR